MARTTQNKDYWKTRMTALEDDQYQQSAAYYKDVQEQFRRASNNIQMDIERWYQRLADNNDISYAAAKRLLKKGELDEFQWNVDQYIKAGKENAVNKRWMKELENASARHHISYLEAMKLQIQQHAELLSAEFEGGMTDYLYHTYGKQYYHTAFEVARGTGVGSNLAKLDTRKVNAIIKRPWARDGANFSDRIWTNKQKLVQNLHMELTQSVICGASPQKAIASLSKTMDVSRYQAGRLIMTESAAISSVAQKDCLKELGVEQYEILATLDSRTSKICRELDGKVFEMKDYRVGETAPPFHPFCRSTTVPYFEDEFTEGEMRAAREEKTGKAYHVPADMNYGEWEKQFVERSITTRQIVLPDSLKASGVLTRSMQELYDGEISIIPENHKKILEKAIKKVVVDPDRNSRYDRKEGILYLNKELIKGEVVHEMAHALETELEIYQNEKFVRVLKHGLEAFSLGDLEYVPEEYGKPVYFVKNPKLVSEYQGRMYEEVGFWDADGEINPYALADYFAEGYKEYLYNPNNLKEHDVQLYNFIKGITE